MVDGKCFLLAIEHLLSFPNEMVVGRMGTRVVDEEDQPYFLLAIESFQVASHERVGGCFLGTRLVWEVLLYALLVLQVVLVEIQDGQVDQTQVQALPAKTEVGKVEAPLLDAVQKGQVIHVLVVEHSPGLLLCLIQHILYHLCLPRHLPFRQYKTPS